MSVTADATHSIASRSVRRPAAGFARLPVAAFVVAALIAAPVLAVLWQAAFGGTQGNTLAELASTVLPRMVGDTIALGAVVLAVVLVLGVGCAWIVAAYEFPGRRLLTTMLLLPLAMPAFVMAFAYTDFLETSGPLQTALRAATGWQVRQYWFPDVRSLPFAGLFLGLALYPYVYALARASFAERSSSLTEAARTLGLGSVACWWRIVWPGARPAVAAGCALVLMETLADFGTVSYFAVDTLSAGVYRAWQGYGDQTAAARLACVLLMMVGALVWVERRQRRRMAFHVRAARPAVPRRLRGLRAAAAAGLLAVPVLLGFVLPAALLLRSMLRSGASLDGRLLQWAWNTAALAAVAAAVILPLGLLIAYAVRLSRLPLVGGAAAVASAGYAVPGMVLAVGLLTLLGPANQALGGILIGTSALGVIYAYGVRFFSIGYQGIEAGLRRVSPSMDATARSLGRAPWQVLRDVHWPLLRGSVLTATLLVFVDCLKELPATYALRPFDFDTLAVVAYQYASDERLEMAAAPALVIVLVGLVPVMLLARGLLAAGRARSVLYSEA